LAAQPAALTVLVSFSLVIVPSMMVYKNCPSAGLWPNGFSAMNQYCGGARRSCLFPIVTQPSTGEAAEKGVCTV